MTESNSISGAVSSTSQTYDNVVYTFANWTNSSGGIESYSSSFSFTPSSHNTYTANFAAKPDAPTNVQAGGAVNDNVRVSWTDNPNSDVTQYHIWRKSKHGSDAQVATVNSGVGSWTDLDYIITGTSSDSMLTYSVYSYYSPSGTLSDPASQIAWATYYRMEKPSLPAFHETAIPSSFSVGNYPNPFNPSTTIAYTLPEEASIGLEVFDMMGRRVRTLLVGSRSAGYYNVVWNGKDDTGSDVSSGVYIYQFAATPSDPARAFRQSGKLMLTR